MEFKFLKDIETCHFKIMYDGVQILTFVLVLNHRITKWNIMENEFTYFVSVLKSESSHRNFSTIVLFLMIKKRNIPGNEISTF